MSPMRNILLAVSQLCLRFDTSDQKQDLLWRNYVLQKRVQVLVDYRVRQIGMFFLRSNDAAFSYCRM